MSSSKNDLSWRGASLLTIADAIGNTHPCYADLCSWADEVERLTDECTIQINQRVALTAENDRLRAALEEIVQHDPHPHAQYVARRALGVSDETESSNG